jgi:hypothetical protein
MDRERVVRTGFDRFNKKDFAGAFRLLDTDAQVSDLLRSGSAMNGRDAVLPQWTRRSDEARVETLVADVVALPGVGSRRGVFPGVHAG